MHVLIMPDIILVWIGNEIASKTFAPLTLMKGHILEMIEPWHFSVHYAFFQTILSVNNVILVL